MDDLFRDHLADQAHARATDHLSGDPAAFERHLARIRQRPDGHFESRALNNNWYPYLPGGWPYGEREVDALHARGAHDAAERERP